MMVSEGPISHRQLVTASELMEPTLPSGGSGGSSPVDSVGFGKEARKAKDMPPSCQRIGTWLHRHHETLAPYPKSSPTMPSDRIDVPTPCLLYTSPSPR